MNHHKILWILQWVIGLYFIAVGISHFIVPDGLPAAMSWMYELSDTQHTVAGMAEILGGLGLILPGLTGVRPQLVVFAALGLAIVMVLASTWHFGREEIASIGQNVVIALILVYVAYGRWKLAPLDARSSETSTP